LFRNFKSNLLLRPRIENPKRNGNQALNPKPSGEQPTLELQLVLLQLLSTDGSTSMRSVRRRKNKDLS
jgi:hypothetical protein